MTLQGFWQTGSKGQLCNVAQLLKHAGFACNMKFAAWQGWVLPQMQGSQAGRNLQQESRPAEFTGSSSKPANTRNPSRLGGLATSRYSMQLLLLVALLPLLILLLLLQLLRFVLLL